MTYQNDLIIRAAKGELVERTPVWLMRQAGRYMPEYMAIKKASKGFLDMALDPDKASDITMQPIKAFDMDAAIIFSDILIIPYALVLCQSPFLFSSASLICSENRCFCTSVRSFC